MAILNEIDFSKYKRFFAFGCSFTEYWWPTWADLIAKEIPESYNFGKSGGGNHFIFNSLMEAYARHKFTSDDLIIVKWTSVAREDRYVNGSWLIPGNIYTQSFYDENFVKNFVNFRGCLIRDCAFIQGAKLILDSFNLDYAFLSMVPIDSVNQHTLNFGKTDRDILNLYRDTLSIIKPSIYEVLYNCSWSSLPACKFLNSGTNQIYDDHHPLPLYHIQYLQKVFNKINFSENTINYANEETKILLNPNTVANVNYNRWVRRFPNRF